jgi:hypothetical protein
MKVPIPENGVERVAALRSYNIMDTAPEVPYDDITELAARICDCPWALIGLIELDKAHLELEELNQTLGEKVW